MRKAALFLLSVVGSAFAVSGSYAQSRFNGFYGQIATGYEASTFSKINPSWVNVTEVFSGGTGSAPSQHAAGAAMSLGLGYLHDLGNDFVLGAGGDYSPLSQRTGQFSHFSVTNFGINLSIPNMEYRSSDRVSAFGIVGYGLSSDKLAYIKFGYSTEKLTYIQNAAYRLIDKGFSKSANVNGFVAGIGYKQIITSGIYGFVEANYLKFSRKKLSGYAYDGVQNEQLNFSSRPCVDGYNILAGIGYKF